MTKARTLLAVAAAAALAVATGGAMAESQYGYATSGTGTVTATAAVKLSVSVPKLIVLRIGSTNTTQDTLTWTPAATPSIPNVPTLPIASANNTGVDWNGAVPTWTAGTQPASLNVYAWTNASAGTINCSVGSWSAANGPANADFTVAVTGTLPHPGANLNACASTSFPSNTLAAGTWAFTLSSTNAGTWKAGAYTNTVTYTAQGV